MAVGPEDLVVVRQSTSSMREYCKIEDLPVVGTPGVPSGTVESETSLSGTSPDAGASATYSRGDHTHGTPPMPTYSQVGAEPAGAVATHAADSTLVHGFDGSGNAPAQSHDNTRHSTAYATATDLTTHTGASAPHTGHVQVGGQLGGTATSPDVRGVRETGGPTLLTLGAIGDGQVLTRSGSNLIGTVPGGGSSPAWHGVLHSTQNGCDPIELIREWTMTAVAGPTPTAITTSIARCVLFRCPAAITVQRVRLFGVGATTGLYKFAIYPKAVGSARAWESGAVNSGSNTWLAISAGTPFALSSGSQYWFCVTVTSTGTTAGFRSLPAPVGSNFWGASAAPIGNRSLSLGEFAQFAVSAGAFPATLPSIVAAAYSGGTTGSVPFALLDSVA